MAKYAPLRLLDNDQLSKEMNEYMNKYSNPIIDFLNEFCEANINITDEEMICMTMNPFFFTDEYNEKIGIRSDVHELLVKNFPKIKKLLSPALDGNHFYNDLKDYITMGPIKRLWSTNKQVYKMDNDFSSLLIETEKTIMYEDILGHLPYNTFYMDLTDLDIPYLEGQFVHVHKYAEKQYCVVVYILSSDLVLFSEHSCIDFGDYDSCVIYHSLDERKDEDVPYYIMGVEGEQLSGGDDEYTFLMEHATDFNVLALSFLMYLGTSKPDIEENPISKSTYRPGPVIRNTFREVRIWDVGIRYGNSFKIAKDEFEKECVAESKMLHKSKKGSPKRPHMRRAHWHRYRTGEGRTETILKWLPPIFVLGSGKEIPVTIHEVV